MKQFLVTFLALCATQVFAQDVIVKKDGSTILSKVLEVNTSDIKYKKFSNLNGPTYTINISEIMSINYENGEKDDFNNENTSPQMINDDHIPEKQIEIENNVSFATLNAPWNKKNSSDPRKQIIERCNGFYNLSEKVGKQVKYVHYVWGMSNSSEVKNGEVEVWADTNFNYNRTGASEANKGDDFENLELGDLAYAKEGVYQIVIRNTSNRIIYVDLGNCFRFENENFVNTYYDSSVQTISKEKSSGVSIGLGSVANVLGVGGNIGTLADGVSVGGQSNKGNSTTYITERILSIPPQSERVLSEPKWVKIRGWAPFSSGKYRNVGGHYEKPTKGMLKLIHPLRENESIIFNESNSPFKRRYILTISSDSSFSNYQTINIELYIHQIIGKKSPWFNSQSKFLLEGVINYNY